MNKSVNCVICKNRISHDEAPFCETCLSELDVILDELEDEIEELRKVAIEKLSKNEDLLISALNKADQQKYKEALERKEHVLKYYSEFNRERDDKINE